ncbi:DUF305 domain-containing protein [Streptomyces physcomitrii]|uniref:DUF305 domain-containing protein n=1 Tax=Streptomyces physcomitrii TaxID=2724184 RepID=UPI00099C9212
MSTSRSTTGAFSTAKSRKCTASSRPRTRIRTRAHGPVVRRTAGVAVTVAAALLLAACGGGEDGSGGHSGHGGPRTARPSAGSSEGAPNAADVAFAQQMIPHHRQALEMSRLAATRAASPQVKRLAERIEKGQDPEIRTMSGWLRSWDEPVPPAGGDGGGGLDHGGSDHDGMDHGGMDHGGSDSSGHGHGDGHGDGGGMPGMMTGAELKKLAAASGKAFDTAFLELMVEHHQGAVRMARAERAKGAYGPAKEMAADVITAQSAEIEEMKGLLGD